MSISLFIKRPLSYPFSYLQKLRKRFQYSPSILILMYHRIIDIKSVNNLVQDGMYVDVTTFEKHIKYLRAHYNIISLETCLNIIRNNCRKIEGKPVCSITFDDGWKDFYDNAFPILKANNAYATVFLPTDYINTNRHLWTDKLGYVILQLNNKARNLHVTNPSSPLVETIENLSGSIMGKYEKAIEILKSYPLNKIEEIIESLSKKYNIEFDNLGRSFLSWEEIKYMYKSGNIYYGSHTKSHAIMTTIPDDKVYDELLQSKFKLIDEGVVNKFFIPFAYPNGNHTDLIANMVKKAGYSMALTTDRGINYISENKINIYKLKRVGIHQDMTSTNSMFACRINGIY